MRNGKKQDQNSYKWRRRLRSKGEKRVDKTRRREEQKRGGERI
jgi:hypothetical protein